MSAKPATTLALQRAVSRIRNVEGECRDLKREIDALKRRVAILTAYEATGHKA